MTHYKTEKKQFGIALIIIPLLLLVTFLTGSTSANLSENENFAVLEATQQPINLFENEFNNSDIETISIPEMASVPSKFQFKEIDDRNQFSFHEKGVHWKAIFEKGKLVELYKDGESIPKEQFPQYEDFINKRYAEFEEDMEDLSIDMKALDVDMKQLNEDLKELKDIKIEFDQEEFLEEMKQVKYDLKLELEELENLDINIDFDVEELNESLKNIKVDLSGLDEGMANLKVELAEMKKELKILKHFMHDLKDGLVADGYLEDDDEDFDLELSETEMILNGKQLPDSTLQKYLKLYKDHFGKDLEDDFTIHN